MAVTANQVIKYEAGDRGSLPVAVSTTLYEGTLGFRNSGGYGVGTTGSGANKFSGVVVTQVDNSAGQNGEKSVELYRKGAFALVGSGFTVADSQKNVYATDNYTITLDPTAANAVYIGKVKSFISTTKLMVELDCGGDDVGAATATTFGTVKQATVIAALTEATGAIGGTNDSDIPSLTATAATLTGTITGTANGSLADVAATAAATAGGNEPTAAQVDTGIAAAVASIVTGVNEQNKEMQTQINALIADNVALRAAARENAAKINALLAVVKTAGQMASS